MLRVESITSLEVAVEARPSPRSSLAAALVIAVTALAGGVASRASGLAELALVAAPLPAAELHAAAAATRIAVPVSGQLYHGVYPGGTTGADVDITPGDLNAYENAVGKPVAWVYFSHEWFRGRTFPTATALWIRDMGKVPFVRLMMQSDSVQNHAEPVFTLVRIIGGDFDADLRIWAQGARDFGSPLLAEYGTEVNGQWFSWNGVWNGADTPDASGNPTGPARFRDAYRHIVSICRQEGATNITWVFHVNYTSIPNVWWNTPAQYYPGQDWVDWLAVSVYGAQTPMDSEWNEFRPLMDRVYPTLGDLSPTKPIIVAEFGVTSGNPLGNQAAWADAALADLIGLRWPRVVGFSWWNERWPNDQQPAHDSSMRVQDNPNLAAVFRNRVMNQPTVLGQPLFLRDIRRLLRHR